MDGADKQSILSQEEIGDCERLNERPRLPCPLGEELEPSISQQHAFATTLLYLLVHFVFNAVFMFLLCFVMFLFMQ